MKESFTTNTSQSLPLEHQGPIVFNMEQPAAVEPVQPETTPVEAPVEATVEEPIQAPVGTSPVTSTEAPVEEALIPTEIQHVAGETPPVEAMAQRSGFIPQVSNTPERNPQPLEVATSMRSSSETTTRTVESGPVLAKGYERVKKFGEGVKGWKGKLLRFGGMLLRGAGKILKGTFKLAKAGLAALVSPDVLMKRGVKSVEEFGTGVKNLAISKTTESYMYARDSFFEAWGGLKAKGNGAIEGAKKKVKGLWNGMVAMKTEIVLQSLEKKRQQAAAQETAARTTREALEAQMAEKMKLLESIHAVTPKKVEPDNNQELALAA